MARLRHVALYADDIEATACFYELKRVLQREHVITLSDGFDIVTADRAGTVWGLDRAA